MHRVWAEDKITHLTHDEAPCHSLFQTILTDLAINESVYKKFITFFPDNLLSNNLANFIDTHLESYLSENKKNIISLINNEPKKALQEITEVFTTFERLEYLFLQKSNKEDLKSFLEKAGNLNKNDLFVAWDENKKETYDFVDNIINEIQEKQNKGIFLLEAIQEYRRSPTARQDLFRKKTSVKDNEILDFISTQFPSVKMEILTRLELYIESGWAAKDNIFSDFYSGKIDKLLFMDTIQERMGELFKSCHIEKEGEFPLQKYSLVIGDEIGKNKIFSKIATGLDAFIKGADGTVYLAEASVEETAYNQRDRAQRTVLALDEYSKLHNVAYKFYIELPCIFYDKDTTASSIKTSFLEKIANTSDEFIRDKFGCLQIMASLDRNPDNYLIDSISLLKKMHFKSVGNKSDLMWEEIISSDNFSQLLLSNLSDVGTAIQNSTSGFTTKGMTGNSESSPIHLFVSSAKGLLNAAFYSDELANGLVDVAKKWDKNLIASKMLGDDHHRKEFNLFSSGCTLIKINEASQDSIAQVNAMRDEVLTKQKENEKLVAKNLDFLKEYKFLFEKFILNITEQISAPFIYSSNYDNKGRIERFKNYLKNDCFSNDNYYWSQSINNLSEHLLKNIFTSIREFKINEKKYNIKNYIEKSSILIDKINKVIENHSEKDYQLFANEQLFRKKELKYKNGLTTSFGKFNNFCINKCEEKEKQCYYYIASENIKSWSNILREDLLKNNELLKIREIKEKIDLNIQEVTPSKMKP